MVQWLCMKFKDDDQELTYKKKQWEGDKTIIRIFAWTIMIHTIYILVIQYVFTESLSLLSHVFLWSVITPISILTLVLVYYGPHRNKWTERLWYIDITAVSVMISMIMMIRTLLCFYGLEPSNTCTVVGRLITSADYSIIYILLGPFLVLNIMNNRLSYQVPAIVILVVFVIAVVMITTENKTTVTYFGLLFIIGAQLMAILVSRSREKILRARYVSEVNNILLSENLKREIMEKSEAQNKAKEEEDKRTQYTSMLFHEMRVPLNSVILSMNDLESDDNLKKSLSVEASENFERIDSGLNSIITVLNDSLDFRKMTEGKLQITERPFEYHQVMTEIVHSMESSWISKNIAFFTDYDNRIDELPFKILGDSQRLRQVVANFLSNAAKFTAPGETITLKTLLQDEHDDMIDIYTHVQDTGIGIKKEDQSRLFKPFVQIDPEKNQNGKGSGLGLSICASIIDSMGGTYGVMSEYGRGSIFWFRVSFKQSNVMKGSLSPSSTKNNKGPTQVYRILIADDEPNTRKIMRRLLERLGHIIDDAEDGIVCLEKVEEAARRNMMYDVLFIDNQMPRLTGYEAIKILRQKNLSFYIVSLTGSGDGSTTEDLYKAGANKVVIKPATLNMLQNVLDNMNM